MTNDPKKSELTKKLEAILTIDGQGRPKKAREFLSILSQTPLEEVTKELKTIGDRKYF